MKIQRIINILLLLLGVYLSMVFCTSIMDYRSAHSAFHFSWETTQLEPLGAWNGAGSLLLIILSFISGFGCVFGILFNCSLYDKDCKSISETLKSIIK